MSDQDRATLTAQIKEIAEKLRDDDLETSLQARITELEESIEPKRREIHEIEREISKLRNTVEALNGRPSVWPVKSSEQPEARPIADEQILAVIAAAAQPVSRAHVATVLGVPNDKLHSKFLRLAKTGIITRTGYATASRYYVTGNDEAPGITDTAEDGPIEKPDAPSVEKSDDAPAEEKPKKTSAKKSEETPAKEKPKASTRRRRTATKAS